MNKILKLILILLGVFIVIIIAVNLPIFKKASEEPASTFKPTSNETVVNDIKYKLIETKDVTDFINTKMKELGMGDIELGQLGGKYIKVTIEAENIGNKDSKLGWSAFYLVDNQEKRHDSLPLPIEYEWIPQENKCEDTLKTGSLPKQCTNIFEVIPENSTGLKIKFLLDYAGNNLIDLEL